jgi:putative ABC transport system ATP-binding protein
MDEPTGNLDSKLASRSQLDQIHADGNTVILVTHEEEIKEHASRHPRWYCESDVLGNR